MSRLKVLLFTLTFPALVLAGGVDTLWMHHHEGSTRSKENRANDVCSDKYNNVYVCGAAEHTYVVNTDMFVAKFDEWGTVKWKSSIGGNVWSEDDMAHAIALDTMRNLYVTGGTGNTLQIRLPFDITWAKYDTGGTQVWIKKSHWPLADVAFDVTVGKYNDVYLCGTRTRTSDSIAEFLVMRIDPSDGDTLWTRSYALGPVDGKPGGPGHGTDRLPELFEDYDDYENCALAMAPSPDGRIVVAGYGYHRNQDYEMWVMKFDSSGTRVWSWDYGKTTANSNADVAFDVAVDDNGNVFVAGLDEDSTYGWNFSVQKLSSTGSRLTGISTGSVDDEFATALALDDQTSQNVYVTGCIEAGTMGYDILTHKLSNSLAYLWGSTGAYFGTIEDEFGWDIDFADGLAYVTGNLADDALVICYSDTNLTGGDTVWTYAYNGPDSLEDLGTAICANDSDHVYVAGMCERGQLSYWTSLLAGRIFFPDPDIAADSILAPVGVLNQGYVIAPRVRLVNEGNMRALFTSHMFIQGGYQDSVIQLDWVMPGDTTVVAFPVWTAQPLGTLAVRCSVAMVGDSDLSNNVIQGQVIVARHDVGCTRLLAPSGLLDSGTVVTPQAWFRNYGNVGETFRCRLAIGAYEDIDTVTLAGGDSVLHSFVDWTALQRGTWAVVCSTMLDDDLDDTNDAARDSVTVLVVDMALLEIVSPTDSLLDSGDVISPRLLFQNRGTESRSCWAYFRMDNGADSVVYLESLTVALNPGDASIYNFPGSQPLASYGWWVLDGWCALGGDMRPGNDSGTKNVFVRPPGGQQWPEGWEEVASMPLTPSGKPVKRGGWLALHQANGLIYGAKGYKTSDFYSYGPAADAWTNLTGMPFTKGNWPTKAPRKGSKGISDGDDWIYVTQGNNSLGFWRYRVSTDTWEVLEDVPLGVTRKKVKGGTDLEFVVVGDTGYVYVLKGYKTEFYRYNTVSGEWQTLASAPTGYRGKWDKGSFIVYDPEGGEFIYAHKAKYHELWKYSVPRDSWVEQLTGMPFYGRAGRKKKSKDGGCAAWYSGEFWALKGGNSTEFWKYMPAGDTWTEKDSMPAFGSSGRKKRVKYGGDIVYTLRAFWALKGNKTVEFWRYGLPLQPTAGEPTPTRSGVAVDFAGMAAARDFDVMPNPLSSGGVIRYSVAQPCRVSAEVYDAAGRSLGRLFGERVINGRGFIRLDTRDLAAGVYLVRLEAGWAGSHQFKLVVE